MGITNIFSHTNRPLPFIIVAFIVKSLFALCILFLTNGNLDTFHLTGGDTINYIGPIENLFSVGQLTEVGTDYYGIRMPGYLPFYFPLRFLFSPEVTLNIIVFFQLVMSALACYYLARLAETVYNYKWVFYSTFIVMTISTYQSIYDVYILSESLSVSFLILALYSLQKVMHKTPGLMDVLVGFLFTWAIFFKPYLIAVYIYYIGFAVYISIREKRSWLRRLGLLLAPYLLITAIWSGHLYYQMGEVVLLQKMRGHTQLLDQTSNPTPQLYEFTKSFGGQFIHWDPEGQVYDILDYSNSEVDFDRYPETIFSSTFSQDSLSMVKQLFTKYQKSTDEAERLRIGQRLSSVLITAKKTYKEERPFDYYVGSRVRLFLNFFFQKAAYNIPFPPFDQQSLIQKMIKVFYMLLYWVIMTFGFIRLIKGVFIRPAESAYFLGPIPGFVLLLFPIVLLAGEQRFAVLAYVFFIPMAVDYLLSLSRRFGIILNDHHDSKAG